MAGVDIDDLPQTWERPGYEALVAALQSLELRPPIWNHRRKRADIVAEQESMASQRRAEAARYLSSIIRSPLAWLDDDGEREEVWELASRRMTERCGRMAMGEVLRSWPFDCDGSGVSSFEPFEVVIKEPAMTGDSLGLKTWGSSYVLAQHLPRLGATSLFRLFDESFGEPRPDVLELGSGTGLLGLAAAAVWKVPVVLSDLPNIVPNLKENADKNASLVEARGGSATVGRLTWGGIGEDEVDGELFGKPNQFKVCATSRFTSVLSPSLPLPLAVPVHVIVGSHSDGSGRGEEPCLAYPPGSC